MELENSDINLVRLMKESKLFGFIHNYFSKYVTSYIEALGLDETKLKYLLLGSLSLVFCLFFGTLSYFLFYVMFFIASVKSMIWFIDNYNQSTKSNSENVAEYYIISIFMVLIMTPMNYIPISYVSYFVNIVCISLAIQIMVDGQSRKKYLSFVSDNCTNKGEFYKLLKIIDCFMDNMNCMAFNMIYRSKSFYDNITNYKDLKGLITVLPITTDIAITSPDNDEDNDENNNDKDELDENY